MDCEIKKALLVIGILASAISCKSFEGKRDFDRGNRDCAIQLLMAPPKERESYTVIGTCTGRGGIMISDGSTKAYDRMMKCACQSGGDAVVLMEVRAGGYNYQDAATRMYGFQHTSKVYTGTVIKMKKVRASDYFSRKAELATNSR